MTPQQRKIVGAAGIVAGLVILVFSMFERDNHPSRLDPDQHSVPQVAATDEGAPASGSSAPPAQVANGVAVSADRPPAPAHDWHVVSIEKVPYLPGWGANPMYVRVVTVMNDSPEPAIFRGQIEFQNADGVVQSRTILMNDKNHNPSAAFTEQVPDNPLEAFSVQVPSESDGVLTGMPTTDHQSQRMVVKLCRVSQTSQDCDSFDQDGKISSVDHGNGAVNGVAVTTDSSPVTGDTGSARGEQIVQTPHTSEMSQPPAYWKTYTNVRFNYELCYPPDLLVPQGESANSDGQKFQSKDDASLIVYGQNNVLNRSLKDALEDVASRLAGSSGKVTYRVLKPNWFVVSGQNGQKLFYAKTLYSHNQFKSFELVYDSSTAAVYDPVVRRLNSCFVDALAPDAQIGTALSLNRSFDPEQSKQLNAQGLRLLSISHPDVQEAKRSFEAAVQLDSGNIEAVNNLGYVYGRIGDYSTAETILIRVLEIAPSRRAAQGNLGYVQAKLGKTQDAAEHFCQYVRLFDSLEQGKSTLARVMADPDPKVQSAVKTTMVNCN